MKEQSLEKRVDTFMQLLSQAFESEEFTREEDPITESDAISWAVYSYVSHFGAISRSHFVETVKEVLEGIEPDKRYTDQQLEYMLTKEPISYLKKKPISELRKRDGTDIIPRKTLGMRNREGRNIRSFPRENVFYFIEEKAKKYLEDHFVFDPSKDPLYRLRCYPPTDKVGLIDHNRYVGLVLSTNERDEEDKGQGETIRRRRRKDETPRNPAQPELPTAIGKLHSIERCHERLRVGMGAGYHDTTEIIRYLITKKRTPPGAKPQYSDNQLIWAANKLNKSLIIDR